MNIEPEYLLYLFPYPKFRKYQKEVILKVGQKLKEGYDIILIEAPTGFGKSAVNTTFCRAGSCIYSTPQLTLIDQIKRDKYLGKYYTVIKGRQNYKCPFNNMPVNLGKCVVDPFFKCDKLSTCPYWKAKARAAKSKAVLTSFSYLILEGMAEERSPIKLGHRDLLILDEAHSAPRILVDNVSVEISPLTVGTDIYSVFKGMIKDEMDYDKFSRLLENVRGYALSVIENSLGQELGIEDARYLDKLKRFIISADMFFKYPDEEWVFEVGYRTMRLLPGKTVKYKYVTAKPVYARYLAEDLIWSRADKFIISSATILEPRIFLTELGIDPNKHGVYVLRVPSTFPPENRPIIDATVGKMTKEERVINIRLAAEKINKILDMEKGNVAIHAHSYEIAQEIFRLIDKRHQPRLIIHNSDNRDIALQVWMQSRGKVFISVRFEEGQDWKGDICQAQILLKVQYPDVNDARVRYRLERKQWVWYKLEALKNVIQAYGRAVRSETDKERFYVIDESFEHLIMWAWNWLPKWFKDALPPHWNKDRIREKIAELKRIRRRTGKYRGWTDSQLKAEAIRLLRLESAEKGLII